MFLYNIYLKCMLGHLKEDMTPVGLGLLEYTCILFLLIFM